jgi:hypothetical protein
MGRLAFVHSNGIIREGRPSEVADDCFAAIVHQNVGSLYIAVNDSL